MKYGKIKIIRNSYPKEMLCWDRDESKARQRLVMYKSLNASYPFKTLAKNGDTSSFRHAKDLPTTKPRTIEDGLVEGDVIVKGVDKCKVLGICGEIVFMSTLSDHSKAHATFFTLSELIEGDWKLQQEQPKEIVKLTFQDISDGKGKGIDPSLISIIE